MTDVFDRHRVAAGGRPRTCTLSSHHQVTGNRHDNRRSPIGAQVPRIAVSEMLVPSLLALPR